MFAPFWPPYCPYCLVFGVADMRENFSWIAHIGLSIGSDSGSRFRLWLLLTLRKGVSPIWGLDFLVGTSEHRLWLGRFLLFWGLDGRCRPNFGLRLVIVMYILFEEWALGLSCLRYGVMVGWTWFFSLSLGLWDLAFVLSFLFYSFLVGLFSIGSPFIWSRG